VTDVVVVGSGASGLPAALRARNGSATVIIVEANSDIGGHAMMSGGSVALGGGTTHQKKYGIEDSPDQVYLENTDPSHPLTRYNDREVVRAFSRVDEIAGCSGGFDDSKDRHRWRNVCGTRFDCDLCANESGSTSTGPAAWAAAG